MEFSTGENNQKLSFFAYMKVSIPLVQFTDASGAKVIHELAEAQGWGSGWKQLYTDTDAASSKDKTGTTTIILGYSIPVGGLGSATADTTPAFTKMKVPDTIGGKKVTSISDVHSAVVVKGYIVSIPAGKTTTMEEEYTTHKSEFLENDLHGTDNQEEIDRLREIIAEKEKTITALKTKIEAVRPTGTADPQHVISDKTFSSDDGVGLEGEMPKYDIGYFGAGNASEAYQYNTIDGISVTSHKEGYQTTIPSGTGLIRNSDGTITVRRGYHAEQILQGASGDAAPSQVLTGITFSNKTGPQKGTMHNLSKETPWQYASNNGTKTIPSTSNFINRTKLFNPSTGASKDATVIRYDGGGGYITGNTLFSVDGHYYSKAEYDNNRTAGRNDVSVSASANGRTVTAKASNGKTASASVAYAGSSGSVSVKTSAGTGNQTIDIGDGWATKVVVDRTAAYNAGKADGTTTTINQIKLSSLKQVNIPKVEHGAGDSSGNPDAGGTHGGRGRGNDYIQIPINSVYGSSTTGYFKMLNFETEYWDYSHNNENTSKDRHCLAKLYIYAGKINDSNRSGARQLFFTNIAHEGGLRQLSYEKLGLKSTDQWLTMRIEYDYATTPGVMSLEAMSVNRITCEYIVL